MRQTRQILTTLALWLLAISSTGQTAEGFRIDTISDAVFSRMQGKSYPKGCTIARSDLRYLSVLHYDGQGQVIQGELVCNKQIASDLIKIFKELFKQKYPIERIQLIDDFSADDEQSMQANNTSCFCFRAVAGSTKLSAHARGMAIDINPLHNPCVRRLKDGTVSVQPKTGRKYANRSRRHAYTLTKDDLCYRLFKSHGFTWGGEWRSLKDYQHFER